MTAVVGLIDKKKVYIGADSAGTDGHGSQTILAGRKVFLNGDMLIGFAGSFRMGQLLEYTLSVPKHDPDVPIDRYMATVFVNEVRKTLLEGGHALKAQNVEQQEGEFLVAYQGRLFKVQQDLAILESAVPFAAVGSGADVCLGSLYRDYQSNHKTKPKNKRISPEEMVQNALEAAAAFDATVSPPFSIGTLG